jgi:hypothetical protein
MGAKSTARRGQKKIEPPEGGSTVWVATKNQRRIQAL